MYTPCYRPQLTTKRIINRLFIPHFVINILLVSTFCILLRHNHTTKMIFMKKIYSIFAMAAMCTAVYAQ